jgi:iron complex transport system substrate-binding protein
MAGLSLISNRIPPAFLLLLILLVSCTPKTPASRANDAAADYDRVVTLAPHLTELMFAIGAQDLLVGVSEFSNYPSAAQDLPRIGNAFRVDQEALALVSPDLVLAWDGGTPQHVITELEERGFAVRVIQSGGLDGVAAALQQLGSLVGRPAEAGIAAADFERQLSAMREQYRDRPPIRVFYQVSLRPLYTVNGRHYISELIELCGGTNIFSDLGDLAPLVGVEAVIDRDPEVLLAAVSGEQNMEFVEWSRWERLAANRFANRFTVPGDLIARPTPRLLEAGATVCNALDQGRRNRAAAR